MFYIKVCCLLYLVYIFVYHWCNTLAKINLTLHFSFFLVWGDDDITSSPPQILHTALPTL